GRVAAAMRAHPELIRGGEAADTLLMQGFPGWTAKGGAEGLLCASGPDGLGVALKVADGSGRGVRPGRAARLARLGPLRVERARAGWASGSRWRTEAAAACGRRSRPSWLGSASTGRRSRRPGSDRCPS